MRTRRTLLRSVPGEQPDERSINAVRQGRLMLLMLCLLLVGPVVPTGDLQWAQPWRIQRGRYKSLTQRFLRAHGEGGGGGSKYSSSRTISERLTVSSISRCLNIILANRDERLLDKSLAPRSTKPVSESIV